MKLSFELSDLHIEASKMNGLEGLINALRDHKYSFRKGLEKAVEFTTHNNGTIEVIDNITRLTLNGFTVDCFQPFEDIDLFYFEY